MFKDYKIRKGNVYNRGHEILLRYVLIHDQSCEETDFWQHELV